MYEYIYICICICIYIYICVWPYVCTCLTDQRRNNSNNINNNNDSNIIITKLLFAPGPRLACALSFLQPQLRLLFASEKSNSSKTVKFAALSTSCVCHEQEQQEPWPMQQRSAEGMPEPGVSKGYPWDHCLSGQCVASLKIRIAYHCHTF